MSALTVSDLHRLGAGLSVRFSLRDGKVHCAWTPRAPTRTEARRLLPAYRRARAVFALDLAQRLGGAVVVVEV